MNLTIDDIHKIRREHASLTQNMSFDEYKADLHKEISPLLEILKSMKLGQATKIHYSTEVESAVVAEPQVEYQKNKNS